MAACLAATLAGCSGEKLAVAARPAFEAQDHGLTIQVSFDGKASAWLLEHGGRLAMDATWYGLPSDAAKARLPAAETSPLVLARQSQTVDPVGQTLLLRGAPLADRRKSDLADSVVRLRVSFRIEGAPPDSPGITCGVVDDAVTALKGMPSEVLCGFAPGESPPAPAGPN
jgi:hypothetical protein